MDKCHNHVSGIGTVEYCDYCDTTLCHLCREDNGCDYHDEDD